MLRSPASELTGHWKLPDRQPPRPMRSFDEWSENQSDTICLAPESIFGPGGPADAALLRQEASC